MFERDDQDPIPNLEVIDVNKVKRDGGSDLYIIIATPLEGTERALQRLLKKVENYLAFIQSEQFREESGVPTPENTRIVVKLHPESAPVARELLERNKSWVRNNDATLVVDADLDHA